MSNSFLLIQNSDFFKLNLLLALTQPTQSEESDAVTQSFLSGLHFKYKSILRRKLKSNTDFLLVDPVAVFSSHLALTQVQERFLKSSVTH
jgi:hypothetical protein